MGQRDDDKKILWHTLAFMAFSTVWGFGNVINGVFGVRRPQGDCFLDPDICHLLRAICPDGWRAGLHL